KCRALVNRRLGPHPPAVAMDDPLYNCQANARPVVLISAVQALEHPEEFPNVLHIKAYAVVLDKIDALALGLAAADFDHRHLPLAGKLEGVSAQIDQDLLEQGRISLTHTEIANRDVDAPPRVLTLQFPKHLLHEVSAHDPLALERLATQA